MATVVGYIVLLAIIAIIAFVVIMSVKQNRFHKKKREALEMDKMKIDDL